MNVHDEHTRAAEQPFVSSEGDTTTDDGRALWSRGVLWIVRATGAQTGGRTALLEGHMPHGPVAPPHHHEREDESFTVLEGELLFSLGEGDDERVLRARTGSFVWIPRGTGHGFRVESESARVLNAYAPAGFEEMIRAQSVAAHSLTLPPSFEPPYSRDLSPEAQRVLEAHFGMVSLPAPGKKT